MTGRKKIQHQEILNKTVTLFLALVLAMTFSFTGYADTVKQAAAQQAGPGAALTASAPNGIRIYVGKRSRTLYLYRYGSLIGSWPCNVGTYSDNGNKKQQGDSTTPSGSFYVCTRNDKSSCYLALGVSYPGTDDADRGLRDGLITQEQCNEIKDAIKNKQQPLWNTALGGEIEIHAGYQEGGTTHGCVAVDTPVMDVLWANCPMGTPIQIGP